MGKGDRLEARRGWGVGLVAVVLALPLITGSGLAIWALSKSPLHAALDAEPTVMTVVEAQQDLATQVAVLYSAPQTRAVATQATGTVTEIDLDVGRGISTGDKPLSVDGIPRVAYVSDYPLYRSIHVGDNGEDVKIAQRLLIELGYLDSDADGDAGNLTGAAMIAFNKRYGDGSAGAVLSPDSLVWIPTDATVPQSVKVEIGQQLATGDAIYESEISPATVVVDIDPAEVARTVVVDGVSATLARSETTVSDEAFVDVVAVRASDSGRAAVTVTLADPLVVGAIPTSAVVTDADGTVCFFPDGSSPAVTIEAGDGTFGMVYVDATLIGSSVLVNPREVRDVAQCG